MRQRAALDAKGTAGRAPHTLHMTATPIPRTLSLTAYGDLDATSIRELPAGRQPVKTWVVGEEKRAGAYGFIRDRLGEGRQAYVVCPLVADSEKLRAKAASVEAERLRAGELAGLSRRPAARPDVLRGEGGGDGATSSPARTDVLVATTVIEVGIDVPNATVMLIEGAERFGLSQLHQLRGRVVSAYLSGVDRAIISEVPFDIEKLAGLLTADKRANPSSYAMMTISEGATMIGGEMVQAGREDAYGHRKLGGVGQLTSELLHEVTGDGVIYQQIGYLMRSGSPIARPDGRDQLRGDGRRPGDRGDDREVGRAP